MKLTMVSKTLLCSVLFFGLALGQGVERPKRLPPRDGFMARLNLTDTQKKDVEKLNTEFAKLRVDQQAKIKTAYIELRELTRADSPDKSAIEKQIGEISDLQGQNRVMRVDHWFAVNKLLTPDQQKVWRERLNTPPGERLAMRLGQFRDRMMRFFHRRQGPPQDGNP